MLPSFGVAQKHDTLQNVEVSSIKTNLVTTASTPVQLLNTVDPSKTNSISLADAVKHFAGVNVKDYGGLGGLKTVSIRSLGANHTGVLFDGIALGDAQGGQIDLGKFSLDNIDVIELNNSSPTDIFTNAKSFSFAALLLLKTETDKINTDSINQLTFKLQSGSFGYFAPTISLKNKFNDRITSNFLAGYQTSKGTYPFVSYENNSNTQTRINSDIKAYRAEYNFADRLKEKSYFGVKVYYYNSKRGLPGAIILYNPLSNQRLNDANFFVQTSWQKKISTKSNFMLQNKLAADNNYYLDPSFPNSTGKLENKFYSKEYYTSAALSYTPIRFLQLSVASDWQINKLKRTDIFAAGFANPTRNTFFNNIAFVYKKQLFSISGNILHTTINEKVINGKAGRNLQQFSEALSASIKPFKSIGLQARIFYKHIFRAPTFNDLYYTNIGNTELKPEMADQLNVGLTFNKSNLFIFKTLTATVDGYFNKVSDKIIAFPRQNLFQWSIQNIGKVKIKGIDVALHAGLKKYKAITITADVAYTYQEVTDVTDNKSPSYNTQLPYTPKHSGSSTVSIILKDLQLNYNIIFSSVRYKQGDVVFDNLLQPWSSTDVSLSYSLKGRKTASSKIIFEANNIFNEQYEVIKYYPMPRFNYRITLIITLKKQKE